jgi:hypothetical protein
LALVDRVGAEHREHEVADEFLAHILDEDVLRFDAQQFGFLAGRIKLLALSEIGGEGHHLAAVLDFEPFQDDRGVETAGIGKDDFLWR